MVSRSRQQSMFQRSIEPIVRHSQTSKKRSLQQDACFFAECNIRGIQREEADHAAKTAQEMHQKWWVQTKRPKHMHQPPPITNNLHHQTTMISQKEESRSKTDSFQKQPMHESTQITSNTMWSCGLFQDTSIHNLIHAFKDALLKAQGDANTPLCQHYIQKLSQNTQSSIEDTRWKLDEPKIMDHKAWKLLTRPLYSEVQGESPRQQPIYTLGRLAFDMFRPTHLLCSITHIHNVIRPSTDTNEQRPRTFPTRLLAEARARHGKPALRDYDLVVDIVVQANQKRHANDEFTTQKAIPARLTNHGYCLPDPQQANRWSIWFSGGTIECTDPQDLDEWKQLFDQEHASRRDLCGHAQMLAARFLLGAKLSHQVDDNGKLMYMLQRPIGGHGSVYIDSLYCDENFRIVQGHNGSIYVFEATDN